MLRIVDIVIIVGIVHIEDIVHIDSGHYLWTVPYYTFDSMQMIQEHNLSYRYSMWIQCVFHHLHETPERIYYFLFSVIFPVTFFLFVALNN